MTRPRTRASTTGLKQPRPVEATEPAPITDAVHELRNALAGVRGAVQVVRDPMSEGMEREILGEVLDRIDHMDRLLLGLVSTPNTSDH